MLAPAPGDDVLELERKGVVVARDEGVEGAVEFLCLLRGEVGPGPRWASAGLGVDEAAQWFAAGHVVLLLALYMRGCCGAVGRGVRVRPVAAMTRSASARLRSALRAVVTRSLTALTSRSMRRVKRRFSKVPGT